MQLVISEISDSAPTALQAVKLFAIYTSQPAARVRPLRPTSRPLPGTLIPNELCFAPGAALVLTQPPPRTQESVLEQMAALLSDSSVSHHPMLLLMAANVEALEGNFPEALKHCHAVQNLELCAPRPRLRPARPRAAPQRA